MSFADELARARDLDVDELADAIETIGFECTRCGACCKAAEGPEGREEHTATVFPDEVRELRAATDRGWRDVARPMPYGLDEENGEPTGETFEWALQTTDCGDCTFYTESDGIGACTVHENRPLICRTYPFSVALSGTDQPMGAAVDRVGPVRAHECEGLGRDIDRADAVDLAGALKERAVRELEEAIAVSENYESAPENERVVVHDSEGAKRPDGSKIDD